MALHSRYAVTVSAAVATRSRADCSSMEDHTPHPYSSWSAPAAPVFYFPSVITHVVWNVLSKVTHFLLSDVS